MIAASVVMFGVAQAQDRHALSHQEVRMNPIAITSLDAKTEPELALSSDLWLTGLLLRVGCRLDGRVGK